jgi:hypothetical protein
MAKSNLAAMSVDALLKLREDIGNVLRRRADELNDQLSRKSPGPTVPATETQTDRQWAK